MCQSLSDIRDSLRDYAGLFDADTLSASQASQAVELSSAIENMASTITALAARRMSRCGTWRAGGERSGAHHLARMTGDSVAGATRCLEVARQLDDQPALAEAARRGELSRQALGLVADAAEADPCAGAALVATARSSSLGELRRQVLAVRSAAADAETRRRRIHARRSLRSYVDGEGAWNLHVTHNPEVGAQLMAAVDSLGEKQPSSRSDEPYTARRVDALVELVCGSPGTGQTSTAPTSTARAKVIVRVDLSVLLGDDPRPGEVCEIAGFGPVAASAVHQLMDTADPFLAAVITRGSAVAGVAHLGRRANAAQQSALEWLHPTCAVTGCSATTWLDNDHRLEWSVSHRTVLDLLDRLCAHHHGLKTHRGWALVEGRGSRDLVAPDDPRHPRHLTRAGPGPPVG